MDNGEKCVVRDHSICECKVLLCVIIPVIVCSLVAALLVALMCLVMRHKRHVRALQFKEREKARRKMSLKMMDALGETVSEQLSSFDISNQGLCRESTPDNLGTSASSGGMDPQQSNVAHSEMGLNSTPKSGFTPSNSSMKVTLI